MSQELRSALEQADDEEHQEDNDLESTTVSQVQAMAAAEMLMTFISENAGTECDPNSVLQDHELPVRNLYKAVLEMAQTVGMTESKND